MQYQINQSEFIATRGKIVTEHAVLNAVGQAGLEEKVRLGHITPTEEPANVSVGVPKALAQDTNTTAVQVERNKLVEEKEALLQHVKTQNELIGELKKQIAGFGVAAAKTAEEHSKLYGNIQSMATEITGLKTQVQTLTKELATTDGLKKQVDDLTKENTTLKKTNVDLSKAKKASDLAPAG